MGLCVSMLQRRARRRPPEPRRGAPKPLFVVRSDRRPPKPPEEAVVLFHHVHGHGGRRRSSELRKPGKAAEAASRGDHGHGGMGWRPREATGVVDMDGHGRRPRAPKPPLPRLPCGGTSTRGGVAVAAEPPAAAAAASRRCTSTTRSATTEGGGAGTAAAEWCRTPTAAPMTPMRPVWQRRILMGMRCELPRFSGLILYDEHGQRIPWSTPGRRKEQQGKKKNPTSTTLRELL